MSVKICQTTSAGASIVRETRILCLPSACCRDARSCSRGSLTEMRSAHREVLESRSSGVAQLLAQDLAQKVKDRAHALDLSQVLVHRHPHIARRELVPDVKRHQRWRGKGELIIHNKLLTCAVRALFKRYATFQSLF